MEYQHARSGPSKRDTAHTSWAGRYSQQLANKQLTPLSQAEGVRGATIGTAATPGIDWGNSCGDQGTGTYTSQDGIGTRLRRIRHDQNRGPGDNKKSIRADGCNSKTRSYSRGLRIPTVRTQNPRGAEAKLESPEGVQARSGRSN